MLFGEQAIPIAEIAAIKHGHISTQQIKAALPNQQWQDYFKFAFVRNPYDRFVSVCAFLNRKNPQFHDNALSWMKLAIERPMFLQRVLVRPQSQQLFDVDGQNELNYVGRYETLQQSMDEILGILKLAPIQLKVRNRSQHSSYRDYYDSSLRDWVAEYYQEDLQRFGYRF